jgi:hypothetical protein
MEVALNLNLPIIGVNLNGLRKQDAERCPPLIRDELVVHISFQARILQHALETWPGLHSQYKTSGKISPFYYDSDLYKRFGL